MANLTAADAIDDGNGDIKLIVGTTDPDTIDTSADNTQDWVINGDSGNDTITTGDGDTGTATGGVTVNAGAGDDNITGGAGDDNLRGEGDNDTINGGDGGDTIDGGAGNDTLNGEAGHDNIDGGLGDDTIDGGDGSDVIIGSAGTDSVTGGTNAADPGRGGFDGDVLQYNADIEILQSITDNTGGNYTIVTDLGTTTIQSGIEFLWFNSTPFININLSDTNNRYGQATDDTLNGDATNGSVILAGAGADTITTGNGENRVYAGSGDDNITLGANNDEVDGGTGTDTVTVGYNTTDVTNYSNDGTTITITTGSNVDVFRNVESFVFTDKTVALANMDTEFSATPGSDINGDANDNTLTGTTSGETINGNAGNDTITPDAGDDTIDGGADDDTVVFGVAKADVTGYSETGGVVTITTAAGGTDTISNVENFEFTDGTVTAGNLATEFAAVNTANQTLPGTTGDDTLTGGLGDDTITPGQGNDTVNGNGSGDNDTVVFSINQSDVTSFTDNGGGSYTFVSSEGTDTISNVESFQFADGTVSEGNLGTTFELVNSAGLTRTGTSGDDTLTGGAFNDTITGDAGNDTLNGAAGDDTITPGAGDDTVDGGADNDTVVMGIAKADVTGYSESGGVVTITSAAGGTDTISNVESFQFTDGTVAAGSLATEFASVAVNDQTIAGTSGDDTLTGALGNDTITPGAGDDTVNGAAGDDTTVFGFAAADLSALSIAGGVLSVIGSEGTDTLTNIENLQFSDQTVAVSDLVLGTTSAETVTGTANADIIAAGAGIDTINAGAGNDLIIGAELGETIDGGAGTDTVKFAFASSEITSAVRKLDGSVEVTTAQGTATLSNVENVVFASEASQTLASIVTAQNSTKPTFSVPDGNGGTIEATPDVYTGPVSYLEYQLLGDGNGNVVTASSNNDFLNLLGGDDAADGGDGDDVLDGGLGSNFLTGGNGGDVFFLDGRGASGGAITWSTITDFTSGDSVNIWGWVDGTSRVFSTDASNGATGFEGATIHYDLDNDGSVDTSITFSGLALADLPEPTSDTTGGGVLIFTAA